MRLGIAWMRLGMSSTPFGFVPRSAPWAIPIHNHVRLMRLGITAITWVKVVRRARGTGVRIILIPLEWFCGSYHDTSTYIIVTAKR